MSDMHAEAGVSTDVSDTTRCCGTGHRDVQDTRRVPGVYSSLPANWTVIVKTVGDSLLMSCAGLHIASPGETHSPWLTAGGNMLSAIVEKKRKGSELPGSESSACDLLGPVTSILINISRQLISRVCSPFSSPETSRDGCGVARRRGQRRYSPD